MCYLKKMFKISIYNEEKRKTPKSRLPNNLCIYYPLQAYTPSVLKCGLGLVTCFTKVQAGRGWKANFTVRNMEKHHLGHLTKVNVMSGKSYH